MDRWAGNTETITSNVRAAASTSGQKDKEYWDNWVEKGFMFMWDEAPG